MYTISIISGALLLTLSTIIRSIQIKKQDVAINTKYLFCIPYKLKELDQREILLIHFIGQLIGLLWIIEGIIFCVMPANMRETTIYSILDFISFYLPVLIGIILLRILRKKI